MQTGAQSLLNYTKIPDQKLNTQNKYFKLLNDMMNPSSAVDTKRICKCIQKAFELRL